MRYVVAKLSTFFLAILLMTCTAAQAAQINITITAHKNRSTEGVVVELVSLDKASTTTAKIEIDQVDKEFVPLVSVTPVGSTIEFKNLDDIKHHVYSVSNGNQFDLPLHNGTSPEPISLNKTGVVKLGCNIHDWMLAYVYVSEGDRVKIADTSGILTFAEVPAGDYEIRLWSPRLRNTKVPIVETITVNENQSESQIVEHAVKLKLRKRIRKPQRRESSSYYSN